MNQKEFNTLIEKYLQGHASAEEQGLLDKFFDQAYEHAGNYPPEKEARVKAELLARITGDIDSEERKHVTPTRWRMLAAVAAIVLMVGTSIFWVYQHVTPVSELVMIHKTTSAGQRSTLTLADGTVVKLNAGSTLSYPEHFENGIREVNLHGEGFFEVTKNPLKPFVINTGEVTTTVLGTSFNVRAYPWQRIQVTVATGKVKVEHNPNKLGGAEPMAVILTSEEQGTYDPVTGEMIKKRVDLPPYLAWKDDILYLQNTPLAELAETLENWYGIEVVLKNEGLGNCQLNGKYKIDRLHNILKSLDFMQGISYRFVNKRKIELSGEPCKPNVPMK